MDVHEDERTVEVHHGRAPSRLLAVVIWVQIAQNGRCIRPTRARHLFDRACIPVNDCFLHGRVIAPESLPPHVGVCLDDLRDTRESRVEGRETVVSVR
jgi:hypothetical protein